jgi:cell division protein FtsA
VTSAKNIYRALERCQLGVDGIVLESLALSRVLLTENDMEAGCVLIDLGGDITNIAVFHDGAIRHSTVAPLGGKNITNDIAIGLRTSLPQAETLKIAHGAALASMVDPTEMISVPGMAGRPDKEISSNVLASIIEPRMEEIFSLVGRELRKVTRMDTLTAGMIVTGGGSQLAGTVELAEQIFDMPVRLGELRGLAHVPEGLDASLCASALGLLVYGFTHEPVERARGGKMLSWMSRLEKWITKRL